MGHLYTQAVVLVIEMQQWPRQTQSICSHAVPVSEDRCYTGKQINTQIISDCENAVRKQIEDKTECLWVWLQLHFRGSKEVTCGLSPEWEGAAIGGLRAQCARQREQQVSKPRGQKRPGEWREQKWGQCVCGIKSRERDGDGDMERLYKQKEKVILLSLLIIAVTVVIFLSFLS